MTSTTIQLSKNVVSSLKDVKEYPRQTYDDIIAKMITVFKTIKEKNQYDEFLHKIQQVKMKELWGNNEDDEWEKA